jgi:hypothetical protein
VALAASMRPWQIACSREFMRTARIRARPKTNFYHEPGTIDGARLRLRLARLFGLRDTRMSRTYARRPRDGRPIRRGFAPERSSSGDDRAQACGDRGLSPLRGAPKPVRARRRASGGSRHPPRSRSRSAAKHRTLDRRILAPIAKDPRGVRDRALLLVGFAAALRRGPSSCQSTSAIYGSKKGRVSSFAFAVRRPIRSRLATTSRSPRERN